MTAAAVVGGVVALAALAIGLNTCRRHLERDRWVRGTVARADEELGIEAAFDSFELSLNETKAAVGRAWQAATGPDQGERQ